MLKYCVRMKMEHQGAVLMDWFAATPKGFRYLMIDVLGVLNDDVDDYEKRLMGSGEVVKYRTASGCNVSTQLLRVWSNAEAGD